MRGRECLGRGFCAATLGPSGRRRFKQLSPAQWVRLGLCIWSASGSTAPPGLRSPQEALSAPCPEQSERPKSFRGRGPDSVRNRSPGQELLCVSNAKVQPQNAKAGPCCFRREAPSSHTQRQPGILTPCPRPPSAPKSGQGRWVTTAVN